MTITPEQRTYARVAGIMLLLKYVFELSGDYVTIMSRGDIAERMRFAAEHSLLWRAALMNVELAWIAMGIAAFALFVVLEPVSKRLAQLALVLRLGACFVGAAAIAFRVAQGRLYEVSTAADLFTPEQWPALAGVLQRGANAGITTAWIFQGAGAACFSLVLLRSRYIPGWLAWLGLLSGIVLVGISIAMFIYPPATNWLKLLGVPGLLADVVTAVLLIRGLPRAQVVPKA